MGKEWKAGCKDCNKKFGYSDWSFQVGATRGQSRPARCPECRKKHNRYGGAMGMLYYDLKPRAGADTSKIHAGGLGAVSHEPQKHRAEELPSHFDPSKYGITDDDVRAVFNWLRNPKHQVAVVVGPTGSGKSTVLPYRLIDPPAGLPADQFTRYGQIVITQPRIQATRNIPAYVAKELYGSSLGAGYDIGFRHSNNPCSDWRNRLVYVTDGTLINWIVNGQIANLSTIMIDEAHERSLNIDLILGLLKKVLPRYPHLKLIISSATINSQLFMEYFGPDCARIIPFQEKRKHNIETFFAPADERLPYEDLPKLRRRIPGAVANKVVWLLEKMVSSEKTPGDILAFLQGERPIEQAVAQIRQAVKANSALADKVDVYPLYTTLPQEEQNKALLSKPDPTRRRVVCTTNVAETSLTVEDVVYVVDSGLINEAQWNPDSQTKEVVTVRHSRAGCRQRWGRAGRITDGEAYCLYTKEQFENDDLFLEYTVPQIQRSALDQIVLTAKAAGVDDLTSFSWMERPSDEELLERAPRVLRSMGALDENNDLTEHGLQLQAFADEPVLAHLMVTADRFACAIEMATLLPMIKLGGLRYLLRRERNWDATTRRAVNRVHKALMKGCRDDIEFCLKLYTAWSETEYDGQALAPRWAVQKVWPNYMPKLNDAMKEALGTDAADRFRAAAVTALTYDDMCAVVRQFGLGGVAEDWLAEAGTAMLRAKREAWAKAFFVNHSILKNKIEPEREALLDTLSGHKKEAERRPIDFDLLDRLRIVFAYCLVERRYEGLPSDSEGQEGSAAEVKKMYEYRLRHSSDGDAGGESGPNLAVRINQDSVCYDTIWDVPVFVCAKQQVITRRLSPQTPPEPVMHVSYLSLVNPEWLPCLEAPGHSLVALGRFINTQTRDEETGEFTSTGAYQRLFLDQRFPLGTRYECRVVDVAADGTAQVELLCQVSAAPQILEDFRGEEPEAPAEDMPEETDAEAGELVDTVLKKEDAPVSDPEEDPVAPWEHLADDAWTELPQESPPAPAEAPAPGGPSDLDSGADSGVPAASELAEDANMEAWPDLPTCRLQAAEAPYQLGDTIIAEVTEYDFDDLSSPVLILQPVPLQEPFQVFAEKHRANDQVNVVVAGYDERPSDTMISLVVREPASGLEILVEPDKLSFINRGFAVKAVPEGTELQAVVEGIDENRRRVYLSCLPLAQAHLEEMIAQQANHSGRYEVGAVVSEATQDKIFLTLDWSDPARGLMHVVSTAGRGLYKPLEAYQVGERCQVQVWFPEEPRFRELPEMPEEVKSLIGKQKGFKRLSWEKGVLYFSGRMPYSLRSEFLAPTTDKVYHRAIGDLYRFSNQLMAETMWPASIVSKYQVGTWIADAEVAGLTEFGAFVQLEPGIKGLLHISQIAWEPPDDLADTVAVGNRVRVRIIEIDPQKRQISLSMLDPEQDPIRNYNKCDKVKGLVTNVTDFGAFARVEPGVNGLVHRSKMWGYVADAREVIDTGDEVDIELLEIDYEKRRLTFSIQTPYGVGDCVEGTITRLEEYGAFVKIGPGITGMLHKSQMDWEPPDDPADIVAMGDRVRVHIIKVDSEKREIGLSLLDPEQDPVRKYHPNDKVRVHVTDVKDYGAFVRVEPGVSGLVHRSKMWGYVPDARKAVRVGDEPVVLILNVDLEKRRLEFSMQVPENDPLRKYSVGAVVSGRVTSVKEYGAFIEIEPGVSGLVYKGEIRWGYVFDVAQELHIGDLVQVRILSIDLEKRQLALSIKQA